MNDTSASISSVAYVGGMLGYLGRSVRAKLFLIVVGALISMLVVFLADWMRAPVYLAEGMIRLGRIDGTDVMPMPGTAIHMNSAPFRRRVAEAIGDKGDGGIADFSVRPETPELALVSVSGPNEQHVTEALQAIVRTLNTDQEKLRSPFLKELNIQMAMTDTNIASLMKVRETLVTTDPTASATPGDVASLALRRSWLLELSTRNEEKLAAAIDERRALAARMGPSKTFPAMLNDDATVKQISPQPVRHALFGGAIALLALVLYAMMSGPKLARPSVSATAST